ncbi:PREDICTED: uncharacterized protein LOC106793950 [Polistes canadensis]|uniref:uncharacterized protein LOC106793950 n=1 Tax=Polistes canadensis TaxID=91411 RepID=UPI000718C7D0|nr:PREDICTED: uncharacterized protein LOC106793950 [Polistes canadensis]
MLSDEIDIKTEIVDNNYKKETNSNDITDPIESISCNNIDIKKEIVNNKYDDITFLARKIREKEATSKEESIKLSKLKVKLIHEVPLQHKIEVRSGTHSPSREELERFKAITGLKKGCFSSQEDDTIVHNWKQFCKLHDWNERNSRAFLSLKVSNGKRYICKKKELKKFVQFLANGLPNRTLFSIYHRFKTLYSSHVNKRYTQEENEIILNYMDQKQYIDEKRKFVDLAKVLNRSRASVWRHYQLLKNKRKDESESD